MSQGFRRRVLLRSKISHVQPPAFESLGPSRGTPCSCETKSIDSFYDIEFTREIPRGRPRAKENQVPVERVDQNRLDMERIPP
jgi:hypothetical protein